MDELIGRLASKAGSDDVVAEKTIGLMLGFLGSEGPSDKVQTLIDGIPGTEAAIAAASAGGDISKLIGKGPMAIGTRLMARGLGIGGNQSIAGELFKFSRDKIGAERMGEIVAGTPEAQPIRIKLF